MVLVTRKEDVVDNFHGTDIRDPYRWLGKSGRPRSEAMG